MTPDEHPDATVVEVAALDAVGRLDEEAGAVIGALREAAVDDGTAREVVRLVTVPLSARPRLRARTAARSPW